MKKVFRRLLVSFLCCTLLLPVVVVAHAAPAKAAPQGEREYSPLIIIPGIGQSPVDYYDADGTLAVGDNGEELGGYFTMVLLDTRDAVNKLLKTLLAPALATLIFQWDLGLSKAAAKLLDQLLAPHKTNPDGTLVNDLRARRMFKSVADMDEYDRGMFYRQFPMEKMTAKVGEDRTFFFAYSLMGDAIQTAKELDEYVQFVKEKTGSDKVSMVNVSLGGSVWVAYLDMFKDKGDLDQVINLVAVLDGSDAVGDLFERNFNLNDRYLYNGLLPALLETLGVGSIVDPLYDDHLISIALRLLPRKALENLLQRAFDFLHTNVLIQNPQLWATVPLARYAGLRETYLTDPAHAELLKKVDAYFAMQKRFDQNTLDAVKSGVRINNICGYGLHLGDVEYYIFGCGNSAPTSNADGIIHILSASQGAGFVPAGTAFPANYTQAKPSTAYAGYSYVSPDRSVDASSCVLPDNTWFFYQQHHEAGRNDIIINLATALVLDDTLVNVHSKPTGWPQVNGSARTDWMRRDWLPRANTALASGDLTPAVRKQLEDAVAATNALLDSTIADAAKTQAVGKQLTDALHAAGITDFNDRQDVEPSWDQKLLSGLLGGLDDACFYLVGARGFSDWWRQPKYPGFFNGMGVLR
ncbi:MAG: hypothetical protein LBS96_02950 [Oscillospiraceae bacterium]|nr:hypothetical protein [Oscillospiraceae bacterium]